MKTATVSDLRNHCKTLLAWLDEGEEILITRRGESFARLVPDKKPLNGKVNWADSPEVTRDRSGERMLTAEESLALIHDAGSLW
jgi:antitoxin (DNA-binding transcriptional repressor) of toxin-antitoxin stability system